MPCEALYRLSFEFSQLLRFITENKRAVEVGRGVLEEMALEYLWMVEESEPAWVEHDLGLRAGVVE